MHKIKISLMEQNDIREAVGVLGSAMLNNPIHTSVFEGNSEKVRQEIEKMFFKLFNNVPGFIFLAKDNYKIIGVMRMKSCTGNSTDDPGVPEEGNNIDRRKSAWFKEWAKHDPVEQHWHLGPIGVLPTRQGIGIGSILMERFCKEVDACKATAYLETDMDKNLCFYNKFGFKVISESEIFGVKNRYMLRAVQK